MALDILIIAMFVMPITRLRAGLMGKEEPLKIVSKASLLSIMGLFLIFAIAHFIGMNIGTMLENELSNLSKIMVDNRQLMESLGIGHLSRAEKIKTLDQLHVKVKELFPAIIVITAVIVSFFEYNLFARFVTKGSNRPYAYVKDFNMDRTMAAGWFFIYLITLIINFSGMSVGNLLLNNINILIGGILSLQGLSLLFFAADKREINSILPMILAILMVGVPLGRTVLYFMGIADLILNLKEKL